MTDVAADRVEGQGADGRRGVEASEAADFRRRVREGAWTRSTSGVAPSSAQANLVVLPERYADDFEAFCGANPRPCPLLERTRPGDARTTQVGDVDLRSDVPRYRVWRDGELVDEPTDVADLWAHDLVAFLLGCSFTFEQALLDAGVPLRHVEQDRTVPMFVTDVACESRGAFAGPLVVSMRPVPEDLVDVAVEASSPYGLAHGAPVQVGEPGQIGVADLSAPDFGEAVDAHDGDVPLFWACGVTPQVALRRAAPPLAITHAPGHMVVTDLPHEALRVPRQSPTRRQEVPSSP